jgi:hypothetical protein
MNSTAVCQLSGTQYHWPMLRCLIGVVAKHGVMLAAVKKQPLDSVDRHQGYVADL